MSDRVWLLRLTLSNGETRHLPTHGIEAGEAAQRFVERKDPYDSDWLDTTDASAVARAHVVEITPAPG